MILPWALLCEFRDFPASGFGVFGVSCAEFRVLGLGFRTLGWGFRVQGSGFRFGV